MKMKSVIIYAPGLTDNQIFAENMKKYVKKYNFGIDKRVCTVI